MSTNHKKHDLIKECLGKDKYFTEEWALLNADRKTLKYGKKQRVYKCNRCSGYHLTTKKA